VNVSEIRGKDSRELRLDIQAMKKELFGLRFRAAAEEISDASRFTVLRRGIARIHTVLRERELEAGREATGGEAASNGGERR
jgi:large subunit ribosomal protein L29